MHRTYIADIERGARNVTLRSVVNLAKALQVTVGNLFSFVAEPADAALRLGMDAVSTEVRAVLLVEDSAADAALTARAFKRARISNPLRTVRAAEAALDYLFGTGKYAKHKPAKPQLILLDLNLPQMSGLEFLRRIRGDGRTREIPVVILTVSQNDRMIIECGRLGTENYIVKPVAIENLVRETSKLNLHLTLGPAAGSKSRTD